MNESERAVMESARFAAMESYFEARPQIAITRKLECVFEAGFDAAYAEVRRLREENERLRKDAERYRWLRELVISTGGTIQAQGLFWNCSHSRKKLDAAIDAARGAK